MIVFWFIILYFSCINSMDIPPYPCAPGTLIPINGNRYPAINDERHDFNERTMIRLLTAREERNFLGPFPLKYRTHVVREWYLKRAEYNPERLLEQRIITSEPSLTSAGLAIMLATIAGGMYLCYLLYESLVEPKPKARDTRRAF